MSATVIIYEDEPELRTHLENVFNTVRNEFCLLGSFEDPENVLDHMAEFRPDVVILDIQMKGEDDGIYALFKIKNAYPETNVLILTTFDHDDKIFHAISLGADGYMLKSDFSSYQAPEEAIRKCINIVLDGGAYLTPSIAKKILILFTRPTAGNLIEQVRAKFNSLFTKEQTTQNTTAHLTPMQLKVIQEIADGKSTAEIAQALNLSENTINTHIKAVYNILGVNSRTKAIRKAMEKKLIKFKSQS